MSTGFLISSYIFLLDAVSFKAGFNIKRSLIKKIIFFAPLT